MLLTVVTRTYYDFLMRQKHPTLPTNLPQQQVFMLAEPKRKPSNFWQNISRLAPFRKWGEAAWSCAWIPSEKALYASVLQNKALAPPPGFQRDSIFPLLPYFFCQTEWAQKCYNMDHFCCCVYVRVCLWKWAEPAHLFWIPRKRKQEAWVRT